MSPPLFRRALLTLSTPTCGTNLDVLLELVTTSVTLVSDELRVAIRCPGITDFAARPVLLFKGVQNLLGQLYVAASAKAVEVDRLLMSVDIIVEGVCGYDPWAEWDEADALIVGKQDLAVAEGINREREARSTAPYKLHVLDIAPPAETAPASSSNVEDAFEEKKGVENYEHVVLGGTFDHLHSGHKILLAMSAWLATKSVTVGIIAPDLLKSKKGAEWMESIETRTANVDKFLNTFKRGLVYDLPTIYDPFGPTKWDPKLQAIVGSRETLQGCVAVNEERKKADLSLLDIYIIDVISSSTANVADMKEKLSSTDIRLYLEKRKKQVVEGEADHQHEQAAANGAPA